MFLSRRLFACCEGDGICPSQAVFELIIEHPQGNHWLPERVCTRNEHGFDAGEDIKAFHGPGHSRNDQVAVAVRLYLKQQFARLSKLCANIAGQLLLVRASAAYANGLEYSLTMI